MGKFQNRANHLGKSYANTTATNVTFGGKTKDEIFDDFLCDLFSSKAFPGLEFSNSRSMLLLNSENKENQTRLNPNNTLPLD